MNLTQSITIHAVKYSQTHVPTFPTDTNGLVFSKIKPRPNPNVASLRTAISVKQTELPRHDSTTLL